MTNKPAKAGIFLPGLRRPWQFADGRRHKAVHAGFPADSDTFWKANMMRHAEAIKEIG
jgi:hypothetical protein